MKNSSLTGFKIRLVGGEDGKLVGSILSAELANANASFDARDYWVHHCETPEDLFITRNNVRHIFDIYSSTVFGATHTYLVK